MADIELDNIDKGREEERSGQDREREETSFTERTEEAEDDYDNIRSRIDSEEAPTQSKTNEGFEYGENDLTELEKRLQDQANKKSDQRYDAIQALESATDTRFNVTHGDSSKELIDYVSDMKYSE